MKAVILVAGKNYKSSGFPFIKPKPKTLYSYCGKIQLKRVIDTLLDSGLSEKDIKIVGGWENNKILFFLNSENYNCEFVVNENYLGSAAYTLEKAVEGIDEDMLLICGDEYINTKLIKKIIKPNTLFRDGSIWKFKKKDISIFKLVINEIKSENMINNHNSNSGVGMTYIIYKIYDRIGYLKKDFLNLGKNYKNSDLDYFYQTDDYLNIKFKFFTSQFYLIILDKTVFKLIKFLMKKFNFVSVLIRKFN